MDIGKARLAGALISSSEDGGVGVLLASIAMTVAFAAVILACYQFYRGALPVSWPFFVRAGFRELRAALARLARALWECVFAVDWVMVVLVANIFGAFWPRIGMAERGLNELKSEEAFKEFQRAQRRGRLRRNVHFFGALFILLIVGAISAPPVALSALAMAFLGVIAIQRRWAWLENDALRESRALPPRLDFDDDMRSEALYGAAFLLVLFPLVYWQLHKGFHLFSLTAASSNLVWVQYAWAQFFLGVPGLGWLAGNNQILQSLLHPPIAHPSNIENYILIFQYFVVDAVLINTAVQWWRITRTIEDPDSEEPDPHDARKVQQQEEKANPWEREEVVGRAYAAFGLTRLATRLRSSDPRRAMLAALGMGTTKDPHAAPFLIASLNQRTAADVRRRVIAALGLLDDTKAGHALEATLKDDDFNVRGSAIVALAQLKLKSAIQPIVQLFADKAPSVRLRVAWALGELKASATDEVVRQLAAAGRDEDSSVRWYATHALGQLTYNANDTAPVFVAISALTAAVKDESWRVRGSAIAQLAMLWIIDTSSPKDDALTAILGALHDDDFDVRSTAAETLLELKLASAGVAKLDATLKSDEPGQRMNAAELLGKLNTSEAVTWLISALHDPDEAVRVAVVRGLARTESERAIEPLVSLLDDKNEDVRAAAANAMGALRVREAAQRLIALLDNKEQPSRVRAAAASALASLDFTDAIPSLRSALTGCGREVCVAAMSALGSMRAKDAVPALIAALRNEDSQIRSAAASALASIAAPKAVSALIRALGDRSEDVRWNAAAALGAIGSTRAVLPLVAAAHDESVGVRYEVATALGRFKTSLALKTLAAMMRDENHWVRRSAIFAVSNYADKSETADLLHRVALTDPHYEVRDLAAQRYEKCISDRHPEIKGKQS
jgi:HEAT repeat protein